MNNPKYAGLRYRILATYLDGEIFFLIHLLFWLNISQSNTLQVFINSLVVYTAIWMIPSIVISLIYSSYLTAYLGGTLGKLLTGIRVTDKNGKLLSLRRSLFRSTVGYTFAWTLFGLGYWSIIKDSQKRGWHDKAIGSVVTVQKALWPLALIITIVLLLANVYLISISIVNVSKGPIVGEVSSIVQDYQKALNEKPSTPPSTNKPLNTPVDSSF